MDTGLTVKTCGTHFDILARQSLGMQEDFAVFSGILYAKVSFPTTFQKNLPRTL